MIEGLRKPFECPADVKDGPFQFDGRFTLKQINGTAAAVIFGDRLLFGFDSRTKTLFAEIPTGGNLVLLDNAAQHIEEGKAFDFRALRDPSGTLTVAINGQTVFETEQIKGTIGTITIRPQRNTLSIGPLSLSGSLRLPEPGLHQSRALVPLLADGEEHPLLSLELVLTEARVLTTAEFDFNATTDLADLSRLKLVHEDGTELAATNRIEAKTRLKGRIELQAGRHRFELRGAINPGTDLLHELAVTCDACAFETGEAIKVKPSKLPPLRLAYPIHRRGQFNCHTVRIPAIARANDGSLLAVYDLRYNSARDLQEHIDIGLSRSTNGGRTWAAPIPIMDMGEFGGKPEKENGCSDPGILVDTATGEIFVTAVWTHGKPGTHQWTGKGSEPGYDIHRSSQFMMVRSKDNGLTWSEPENLTRDLKDRAWHLFAPAPGNGITLRNGTLVMPTQGRDKNGLPFSNITWSKDHGKTWTVSNPARDDTTECSVAELSDGSLLLNMRDNRNRSDKSASNGRALSTTTDLGQIWRKHPADHGALPEPVCMASMISHTLADGRHLLVFSNPRNKTARRDMTIQFSLDDGKTWPAEHYILLDEKGGAYSSLVMIDDQTLGILYESSQADLVFQKLQLPEFPR